MQVSRTSRRVCLFAIVACLCMTPVTAQRGGKGPGNGGGGGGGGGGSTNLPAPVLIAWPEGCGGAARRYSSAPSWISELDGRYDYYHPDVLEDGGNGRGLVQAVSQYGDLTHGGGDRFIVDLRQATDGSLALIATAETPGTPENPTWYYAGAGSADATTDHVLLTDQDFRFDLDHARARWSRDGSRIAFVAESVASGDEGIFLGDVTVNAAGHPDGLSNIRLIAAQGREPLWGDATSLGFYRGDPYAAQGFVLEITDPNNPLEVPLGPILGWVAPNSSGDVVAYARSAGGRQDIFVLDLPSGVETQVTDSRSVPEARVNYPTWSPDDTRLVVSVEDGNPICQSLAELDLVRGRKRRMWTSTIVVTGTVNSIVGGLARAIWGR